MPLSNLNLLSHRNIRTSATFQKMSGFPLRKRGPVSRQEHCWTPEIVPKCA